MARSMPAEKELLTSCTRAPIDAGPAVGAAQEARGEIGPVVEPVGGLADPLADGPGDTGLVVDDPGDGLETHPGQGRDIAHRRAAASASRSLRA